MVKLYKYPYMAKYIESKSMDLLPFKDFVVFEEQAYFTLGRF